jgi:DNA-binding SARP family transcriptional activator
LGNQHILVVSGREAGEPARDLLRAAAAASNPGRQASALLDQVLQFEKDLPSLRRRLRPRTAAIPFAPPKLTIQALGKAQVLLDGKPVTAVEWQNQKRVRELLFFLLANPAGLTKEAIGLVIWPESSAGQLKLQFKNASYRLRHALGQEVLSFEGERYWFNRDLDYEYDVENFLGKIARAQAAADAREKISAYQAAVDLYQGEYLPEVGGTWVVPLREQLWQKYAEARLSLARLYLEAGEAGPALEGLQRLLLEDTCLEEAHRLAMRAHAARGDRAGLTRQFERCRRALLEEMDLQPSAQTIELYETLRR